MSDHHVPARLAEPPPSFDIALLDGDTHVGFITPQSIGFAGFASETEAAYAAWAAHRLLSWRRAGRPGSRPVPVDTEPLTVRHGDTIQVDASGRPFAELRAPGADRDAWAFVLPLQEPLPEVFVSAKAYAIYRMLRRSGIRWRLFARPVRPEPAPGAPRSVELTAPSSHWFEAVLGGLEALRRCVSASRFAVTRKRSSHVEHPV